MSYAMLRGLASDMSLPRTCGPNSAMNPLKNQCYCQPGFTEVGVEDPSKGCVPINTAPSCEWIGQIRSPVDKRCECPPGMSLDPRPEGTACIPMRWFPDCLDVKGARVPGCFMGFPTRTILPALAVGVVLGGVLTLAINAVRS